MSSSRSNEPPLFTDLSLAAQSNFAELVEQAQARMLDRSILDLPGSFASKEVKGSHYRYWQYRDLSGVNRQVYLGPDDDRLRELIRLREGGHGRGHEGLARLAAACAALGCQQIVPAHFKIIARLSDHGFFSAGGVLIGTHAFIAMGNMLGVQWASGWRTNDIDFAHAGKSVTLALPATRPVNVHDAITSLELGLLPARSLTTGTAPAATYLNPKDPEMRIDFLTTMTKPDQETFRHEALGASLQPLKFMEFTLEQTTQTAVISGENALMVNIPSPMRYALHKLIVMVEREDKFRTKVGKDASQVAAIVSYATDHMPAALQAAADDIMARGKGWRKRVLDGVALLARQYPAVAADLRQRLTIGL